MKFYPLRRNLFLLLCAAVLGASPHGARATIRTVTSLSDSGPGSLRQALSDAVNGDIVNIGIVGTITLTSGQLLVSDDLTINGPGAASLTVRRDSSAGTPNFRVFGITSGVTVTLAGITVANGRNTDTANTTGTTSVGGGIYNAGTLTVNNCVISGNTSLAGAAGSGIGSKGGGIFNNAGSLTVNDTTISANSANNGCGLGTYHGTVTLNRCTLDANLGGSGAGLDNYGGAVTLESCALTNNAGVSGSYNSGGGISNSSSGTIIARRTTLANNRATSGGGVINFDFATLTLENCTLSGNRVDAIINPPGSASYASAGGAISNRGQVTLTNCTISGNTAQDTSNSSGRGGAVFNYGPSHVTATDGTIANNTATHGGGVYGQDTSQFSALNTILALNTTGGAAANLSLVGSATLDDQGHNLIDTDPQLGPLQNNGGPTSTHLLLPGSPAIDAGDDSVLGPPLNLTTDQRGLPRQLNTHVDIGAVEYDVLQSGPNFEVNTTAEHGGDCGVTNCTLLEALNAANANPDNSTVTFKAGLGGVILNTIAVNGLTLKYPVTINGPGARVLTLSGNHSRRLFSILPGASATISGLTLAHGNSGFGVSGGAIYSEGTLHLLDCAVLNNSGGSGGGVANQGTLTVTNCTFAGNQSTGHGGAIRSASNAGIASATITNSTFSGNSAVSSGAITVSGTAALPATLTLSSCTLSGNSGTDPVNGAYGGGINNFHDATVNVQNCLIAGNSATALGNDVYGTVNSQGTNLIGNTDGSDDGADGSPWQATDLIGNSDAVLDPRLGALANNGGPTDTFSLRPDSPAIDAGDSSGLTTDQRGFTRPFDQPGIANVSDGSDIGAYERQAPALLINDVTVTEGNVGTVNALFTVTLRDGPNASVSVHYATADGTATAGSDYSAVPDTVLTFTAGQTSKTIAVPILGDTLDEANETFKVNLSSASAAGIADGLGVGTIKDDDATPRFFIDDVTLAETNGGSVSAVFHLTLSAASGRTVTVTYKTADGTATAPADYIAHPSTTLTFAPGQTAKTITVGVKGDAIDEANETFKVVLQAATNAAIVDDKGVGTITDDDPLPSLTISDAPSLNEGNAGSHNALFTVTLTGATNRTVTVNYATANGTATAGSDYTAKSGTLTFSPGQTSKTLPVQVLGDTTVEPDEGFKVNLSGASFATISDSQGVHTITNDDASE